MYNPNNTVIAIVENIAENDDYSLFPILADALEEDNFNFIEITSVSKEFILNHLRNYKTECLAYMDRYTNCFIIRELLEIINKIKQNV